MNRYSWPEFKKPKSNHGIAVGHTVKIKNKAIVKAREMDNFPASNVGVVTDIDEYAYNPVKVKHNGEAAVRQWRWDDIEIYEGSHEAI